MSTPFYRHWKRALGPKIVSGVLVVLGFLIMAVSRCLPPDYERTTSTAGMIVTILGIVGILVSKQTMLD